MKFRAVIKDSQYMREFQNIILTFSKLAKEFVMNISMEKIYLIANEELDCVSPMVWADIGSNLYFDEYLMQGVNDEYPNILLSMSALNMARALEMLRHNTRRCKIKLTNIQFPCLTIELDVLQSSERMRQVVHDVPVTIIPLSDWCLYNEPKIPKCKVVLNIPSNRFMRGLVDKMKNLSPNIVFYVTSKGEMSVVAEAEMATITTRYKNLEIRALNPSDEENKKDCLEASCSVDCKKTSIFFSALQVQSQELSCGIDDDNMIHMEVYVRQNVIIHSILPAVSI